MKPCNIQSVRMIGGKTPQLAYFPWRGGRQARWVKNALFTSHSTREIIGCCSLFVHSIFDVWILEWEALFYPEKLEYICQREERSVILHKQGTSACPHSAHETKPKRTKHGLFASPRPCDLLNESTLILTAFQEQGWSVKSKERVQSPRYNP